MTYIFKMPAVGEGIMEGEIVKWSVDVGDTIEVDSTLVEIQNDKLIQEVPSPVSGTIIKLLKEEGSVVEVGEPLAQIDTPDDRSLVKKDNTQKDEVSAEKKPTNTKQTKTSNYILNLPKVGEGIMEGEILEWFKNVGDKIKVDEALLEVQNDKLVQEVPSPVTGIIDKILINQGSVAQVGQPIAELTVEGYKAQADQEVLKEEIKREVGSKKSGPSIVAGRVLAMPSVRQYARNKNIEISEIEGTGKHGHITVEDIDNYIADDNLTSKVEKKSLDSTIKVETQVVSDSEMTKREKMSPTRRAIAEAMVNSKVHAPHVTIFDEVEVSKLMSHRKHFKEIAAKQDISLTYLSYMTKAVVNVLRKFPILNSSVDEVNDEIIYKKYYNIGIAVDTDRGLFVPNIKKADSKGIFAIANEISTLANKTHEGDLTASEMRDGTATISNIGSAWGMWFTPIINYPEVVIFGMGRIESKPIVLEDKTIGVGSVLHLSMSFDHRVVDGMVAQLAMNELKRLLADPELILMEG